MIAGLAQMLSVEVKQGLFNQEVSDLVFCVGAVMYILAPKAELTLCWFFFGTLGILGGSVENQSLPTSRGTGRSDTYPISNNYPPLRFPTWKEPQGHPHAYKRL